jgi:hypothetical protein
MLSQWIDIFLLITLVITPALIAARVDLDTPPLDRE